MNQDKPASVHSSLSSASDRLKYLLYGFRFRITSLYRKILFIADIVAVTLLCACVGGILYFFTDLNVTFAATYSPEAVLIQIAATIGTIVAIVFGLAVLPIQKAAEALSPGILRLYAKSRSIRFVFIILGINCVSIFLLAPRGIGGLSGIVSFVCAAFLLACSIDLLRWFHRLITELLDPAHALQLAISETLRIIDILDKTADQSARLLLHATKKEAEEKVDQQDIKGLILQESSTYVRPILYWITEIGEIARKACSRGEKRLSEISIHAISKIMQHYLSARRDNIKIYADLTHIFAKTNNANAVMQPTMETLIIIGQSAIRQRDDDTALAVAKAYRDIAIFASALHGQKLEKWHNSLAYSPTYYLCKLLREGASSSLTELPFQGASELRRLAIAILKDGDRNDAVMTVVEELATTAAYFYSRVDPALAEEVVAYMAEIYAAVYENDILDRSYLNKEILKRINALAPLAIAAHSKAPALMSNPLDGAYALIRQYSLPHTLVKLLVSAKFDAAQPHSNPYHMFIKAHESFRQNLREMATAVEFGPSRLLWDINEAVFFLTENIAMQCAEPIVDDWDFEKELLKEASWLLSVLWVAFDNKKQVDGARAEECCDTLAAIGMLFLGIQSPEIAASAISHIRSIAKSLVATMPNVPDHILGNCLSRIGYIEIAAEAFSFNELATKAKNALIQILEGIDDVKWRDVQAIINLRMEQLRERRDAGGASSYMHAETVLDKVLQESIENKPSKIASQTD